MTPEYTGFVIKSILSLVLGFRDGNTSNVKCPLFGVLVFGLTLKSLTFHHTYFILSYCSVSLIHGPSSIKKSIVPVPGGVIPSP